MAKTRPPFSLCLPFLLLGLSACVAGRDYSIADSAGPASAADQAAEDSSAEQEQGTRIVFTPGPDGTLQTQTTLSAPVTVQAQAALTTRYAVGNLTLANLAVAANGTIATAGLSTPLINAAVSAGLANASAGASAGNLLTASFSTQSVRPVTGVTGGSSGAGAGATGTGAVGGTVGGTVGTTGGGQTTPPTVNPPQVIPPVVTPPRINPTGPTAVTGGGLAGVTTPLLPH